MTNSTKEHSIEIICLSCSFSHLPQRASFHHCCRCVCRFWFQTNPFYISARHRHCTLSSIVHCVVGNLTALSHTIGNFRIGFNFVVSVVDLVEPHFILLINLNSLNCYIIFIFLFSYCIVGFILHEHAIFLCGPDLVGNEFFLSYSQCQS